MTVTAAPVDHLLQSDLLCRADRLLDQLHPDRGRDADAVHAGVPDGGDKAFDGTTATTLTGFRAPRRRPPGGVTLVAGPAPARLSTPRPRRAPTSASPTAGYTLGGPNAADQYALAANCCGPAVNRTSRDDQPCDPTPTADTHADPTPTPTRHLHRTHADANAHADPDHDATRDADADTDADTDHAAPTTPTPTPTPHADAYSDADTHRRHRHRAPTPTPLPPRPPWTSFDVPVGPFVPNTPEDLLELMPNTTPPVTLTVTPTVEVPVEVPYVAPVLKPKPYRN